MNDKIDIGSLEGWLIKKKSPRKQNVIRILSGDTRRWFQVKELRCSDRVEITLCYFKSPYETEARGWIYLNDVTQISEDGRSIKIVSFARTITVEAKSRAEHNFWFEGISKFCPSISRTGCKGILRRYQFLAILIDFFTMIINSPQYIQEVHRTLLMKR